MGIWGEKQKQEAGGLLWLWLPELEQSCCVASCATLCP